MTARWRLWLVLALRCCVFALALLAMVASASRISSPLLATGLWLSALVVLVSYRGSLFRRGVSRALGIPKNWPQSLVRSGASLRSACRDESAHRRRGI
jgi:hypothetical protein